VQRRIRGHIVCGTRSSEPRVSLPCSPRASHATAGPLAVGKGPCCGDECVTIGRCRHKLAKAAIPERAEDTTLASEAFSAGLARALCPLDTPRASVS
jgi:hypothetical protein